VRLQVVHGNQRLLVDEGNGLARGQSDDDPADQPRPGCRRDAVQGAKIPTGVRHGGGDDNIERFDMGTGGNFRYHAAKRACSAICDSTTFE